MGSKPEVKVLSDDEFAVALANKLIEEAEELKRELQCGVEKTIIEELADIMEVLDTLVDVQNIDWFDVDSAQEEKHNVNGGFSRRYLLIDIVPSRQ